MSLMKKIIIALTIFLMTLSPVKAETISFKDVLDKAIKRSYDLKLSQTDIKISETEIKEARSAYFRQFLLSMMMYIIKILQMELQH